MIPYVGDWADDPAIVVDFDTIANDIIEVLSNRQEYYDDTLDKMFKTLYNRYNITKREIGAQLAMKAIALREQRKGLINEM